MTQPTLIEVIRLAATYLADHGVDGSRLDAELLAAHSLGLRRLDLYLQFDRPLREDELAPLRELLRRRTRREPVAYLTGVREFCGRCFRVTPAVLVPRPETETVVERVLAWARGRPGGDGAGLRIADAGAGSGCIAVTLAAELGHAEVVALEVSAPAAAVARENARALGVADRVEVVQGGWREALAELGSVDAVAANPPYVASSEIDALMPDVRDFEPRVALDGGPDGLAAYRELVPAAAAALGRGGLLALEIDPRRRQGVVDLVAEHLPGAVVTLSQDLAGTDRVVEAIRAG